MATTDLRSVLTAELFQGMVDSSIPYSTTEPIDFSDVIAGMFGGASGGAETWESLKDSAWAALKALSELGVDKAEDFDFQRYLPPPEDASFLAQSLGFILLLDQAPRRLCHGLDSRYTDAYFAVYALRLFRYLHEDPALPTELRPTSWTRWEAAVGAASFDYFIAARLSFNAVLAHNESTAKECLAFTEEARVLVEQRFGVRDPHRDEPDKRWDLYGFPKIIASAASAGGGSGLPKGPMGVVEGWFWLAWLVDVHYPILERYGRYPYRNGAMGRTSTVEEEAWVEKAAVFPQLPADVRDHMRMDAENGRWSPLGAEIKKTVSE
ncbi:uncharacterized protein B0I36DRAFT_309815 [Microdochium trichocladiopsis]|uniref:Uncharacterized protein n=1 Tax=Microdochium trichocladiopsis TaxID=1682393 RepID=A0A9P8YJ88_9PEZI|nr:uncharacterized protein B0I36DRAFT_309815 [Microdochium trichocladiopsis]KAH7040045.1 hypothetical protein B0I36DRAFT_309815 [Microdochium trichocladiopsis]